MQPQAKDCHTYPRSEERQGTDFPSEPSEGTSPADAWVLDFWLLEQGEDTFVLFLATQFWQFAAVALQNECDRAGPLEQGPRQACTEIRFFKQRTPRCTGPNTFCKPRAN